jgi:hypothetical protein
MATSSAPSRTSHLAPRTSAVTLDYRPSYLAAAIAATVVFLMYLVTLAPSTAMWDTSEYITAACTLGLPHPPGNPLFVIVGRVFCVLPIPGGPAVRINILAALSSAVSAGMWFLITERVLVSWLPDRWQRIVGGALATLIGAAAFTVWNQSVVNEKVYTVSLMGIAIISWLMIRWSDDPDGRQADRILVLVAYLLGLGYANHMGGMLAAPAAALAVVVRRPRTLLRWRLLLACCGALVLGMTPFATQPIRAAHFPPINEGEPTACRTELTASCTFSKATYDAFKYNFDRGQYGKPSLSERQAPFSAQLGMWWYYFKWQWLRDAHNENPGVQSILAAVFLVLGLFGGWVHWRRDRQSFWYFGSLMFTMTLLLIYYLNFKYGNTQSPELGDSVQREVRDRDYFFLWSFSAWGVWAALGLVYLWETLASLIGADRVQLGREVVEVPRRKSLLVTAPVLALALIPLITNAATASRAGETDTRDFAHDLLNSVEPYGVLVTVGDNDTFPLWYAQEVEAIRKDVVVANTSLLNTDWYVRQLIRRPVYEYDEAKGPGTYRGGNWKKPSGPPLKMTLEEADSVPAYTVLNRPMVFRKGEIRATIDPRKLVPAGENAGLLQRADIFVLYMLRDAYPERPIYFSRTSGGYAQQLGLDDYTITQGLASKVFVPPPAPGRDTLYIQGDGWFDVKRTETLWKNVFLGPQALIKKGDWIDRPSVGIPYLYVATGLALAEALRATGRPQDAQQVLERSRQIAAAVRLERLLAAAEQGMQVPAFPSTADSDAGRQLPVQTP